ncbi:hypothetical protein B0I27_11720 [Arcticibacter pallidicorallinus]|uniref:Peptidase MA superfamily protein n=1 Tax=Arcticibacter pallidicorallinus TaxID=1259464 RepID=A0A2T0TQY3_9SPHI|nr:hypothetical protein [Arcticibacter pallidicorallinus]PRY48033.1 hypothetical protein B0I27_11720 [Arcticibacter pallidicorallinus]
MNIYMVRNSLLSLIVFLSINARAQISINPGVDTSGVEVQKALAFYKSYLASFNGKSLPDFSKYWTAEELKERKVPDQIIYAINESPLYSWMKKGTVLYIKPKPNYIHFKTQFSYADSSNNIATMAITNSYVAFDKDKPYFVSPIKINIAAWKQNKVRNITFHYPPYHKFNAKRADSLVADVIMLEKEWNLKPIDIKYYLANTKDELDELRGFDFVVGMGNKDKPGGISDDIDNQVYCGGLGENYFHEVVHVYLNRLHPQSPLIEGLAVFYGGSMGRPVSWHLKRVNQYLEQHPEVDLNNLEDFWYTDPYTNPGSAIHGMICHLIYDKGGFQALKKAMTYTALEDIFEKELHVAKGEWNRYLRAAIARYC